MLFDSIKAERLYKAYALNGNAKLLDEIHGLANDYIKVIAGSMNQDMHFDDLVQEGHLKLHILLINLRFRPSAKCSMYTFLNWCLKRAMIDYLRKMRSCAELDDDYAVACSGESYVIGESFDFYYQHRFPSIPSIEPTEYVKDAILEQLPKSKVVNTLVVLNNLHKSRACLLYNSVNLFMKASVLMHYDVDDLVVPLQYAVNGHEFTLFPESVLLNSETSGYKNLLSAVIEMRKIVWHSP